MIFTIEESNEGRKRCKMIMPEKKKKICREQVMPPKQTANKKRGREKAVKRTMIRLTNTGQAYPLKEKE
jgi:hypothetical protein